MVFQAGAFDADVFHAAPGPTTTRVIARFNDGAVVISCTYDDITGQVISITGTNTMEQDVAVGLWHPVHNETVWRTIEAGQTVTKALPRRLGRYLAGDPEQGTGDWPRFSFRVPA